MMVDVIIQHRPPLGFASTRERLSRQSPPPSRRALTPAEAPEKRDWRGAHVEAQPVGCGQRFRNLEARVG